MEISKLNDLNEMHLSVLTEIGNIGSGNAATALATMMNTVVDIEIPSIHFINYEEVSEYLGGPNVEAVGIMVNLSGDFQGAMLQVVQETFASRLINTFYETEISSLNQISDMDLSVIREMGNITTAAYINSIAKMTDTFINISPPEDYIDSVANILSVPSKKFAALGDKVLFIEERLRIAGTEINSNMILILEINSMNLMFKKLGIPV